MIKFTMKFIIVVIVLIVMLGYSSAPANKSSSTVTLSRFPGVPTILWKNNTDLSRPSHCFLGDPEVCCKVSRSILTDTVVVLTP